MQVVIVIVVIIIGAFKVDVSNWTPFAPNGYKAVFTGATVVFFAYVGFDAVANSAEESKRPQVCLWILIWILFGRICCTGYHFCRIFFYSLHPLLFNLLYIILI